MNTDSSLFSFPKSQDPSMTAALRKRLYPVSQEDTPFKAAGHVKEIKKPLEIDSYVRLSPICSTAEQELENRIASFQKSQAALWADYREQAKQRAPLPNSFLGILTGSKTKESGDVIFFNETLHQDPGGYFLRWNKKGIVINPGKGFIRHFHRYGLHISDIDFVIATQSNPETYEDIHDIYELNYQLNRTCPEDLRVIHYYLNPAVYQELSIKLKPNFKQERHTIHRLELFADSPDVEKVDLNSEISLLYFPTSTWEVLAQNLPNPERSAGMTSALGIRLELRISNEKRKIHVGYLAGTGWSPLLSCHLEHCDVLIAGFGNTHSSDYNKISYTEGCLGYFGCFSLIEETDPKVAFCTEFTGRKGDISIEIIKKMRHELAQKHSLSEHPRIFPGDAGLFFDLSDQKIRCSITGTFVDLSQIHVARSSPTGALQYLSPACFL
jgi:hypothetical protein